LCRGAIPNPSNFQLSILLRPHFLAVITSAYTFTPRYVRLTCSTVPLITERVTTTDCFCLSRNSIILIKLSNSDGILSVVLKSEEEILGPNRSSALITLGTLANVARKLGRFKESNELYRKLLKSHLKTLGTDNEQVLRTCAMQMQSYERAVGYF
jgi:hypothetical protein